MKSLRILALGALAACVPPSNAQRPAPAPYIYDPIPLPAPAMAPSPAEASKTPAAPSPAAPLPQRDEAPTDAEIAAPTTLEELRISGAKTLFPDDVTRADITRSLKTKLVTTYRLCIGTDGAPFLVQMLKSSEFPAYDAKIQAQMVTWRYRPYTVDGVAKKVCTSVTFIYQQRNDASDPSAGASPGASLPGPQAKPTP